MTERMTPKSVMSALRSRMRATAERERAFGVAKHKPTKKHIRNRPDGK